MPPCNPFHMLLSFDERRPIFVDKLTNKPTDSFNIYPCVSHISDLLYTRSPLLSSFTTLRDKDKLVRQTSMYPNSDMLRLIKEFVQILRDSPEIRAITGHGERPMCHSWGCSSALLRQKPHCRGTLSINPAMTTVSRLTNGYRITSTLQSSPQSLHRNSRKDCLLFSILECSETSWSGIRYMATFE